MPLIKGTSSVSDSRALSKALKQTKFPPHFSDRIESWSKIQRVVIIKWIEQKITTLLGFEDEIVASTAVNLFLPPEDSGSIAATTDIDPRKAQIDLGGFLGDEDAAKFSYELWELLLDASKQPTGIPRKILDEKKKEIESQKKKQQLQQPQPQQQELTTTSPVNKPPKTSMGRERGNRNSTDTRDRRHSRNESKQPRNNPEIHQDYRQTELYNNRHIEGNKFDRYDANYRFEGPPSFNDYEYDSFGRRLPPRPQYHEAQAPYHRSHRDRNEADQAYSNNRGNIHRQYHSSVLHHRDDERFMYQRESNRHRHSERSRSRSRSRERNSRHERRSHRRSRRSPSESSESTSSSSRSR